MINEEIRSYEVSVWTLQDEFITVLKWSNVENKGTIQEPKMIISDDGTQSFTFTIPMYLYQDGQFVKNPIWYNTRNGNLMVSLRKIKVIFNKEPYTAMMSGGAQTLGLDEKVFEFLITKITEEHESDHLFCNVECEGLAFHELGKIGYTFGLSQADVEYDFESYQTKGYWKDYKDNEIREEPRATIDYWCDKIGLEKYPNSIGQVNPRKWYYKVMMDWTAYSDRFNRNSAIVYEDEHATSWQYNPSLNDLEPVAIERSREKERIIEANESNIYNITQTISETFEVFCRYEYIHDDNYRIIGRLIIFFNNFVHDNNMDIMSLTYPYSSSKISREMDSSSVVTKLFVKSMEDSTTYLGEASIRYCDANKMQEDYIFNFDYMKETGAINEEQYAAIKQYEIDMFNYNTSLYPIESKIEFYSNKLVELKAKKTVYENSIKLDQEQQNINGELALSLIQNNSTNPSGGYIDAHNENNPDLSIISTDAQGNYCIKLGNKEKGIHPDSVKIYRTYNSSNHVLSTEVTGFSFSYDEYGNPTAIYGVPPNPDTNAMQPNTVYMTYVFEPKLYYDAIVKTWQEKEAVDKKHLADVTAEIEALETELEAAKEDQEDILNDKKETMRDFNEMMGPALREGYWQPEDYQDYGERHESTHGFESTYSQSSTDMASDLNIGFATPWDTDLFEEEQDIYFTSGTNETKLYYPCVNLTSLMSDSDFVSHPEEYCFVFNNHYYNAEADKTNVTNIRRFSIGSEAILGFVKNSTTGGTIYPALILVGTKNMTRANDTYPIVDGGTIGFMMDPQRGTPRISKISIDTTGKNITVSEPNETRHNLSASDFTFGGVAIENCVAVMPRIRFTSLMLKTNTGDLYIKYPYNPNITQDVLTNIEDYYIRNRRNPNTYKPEYLITLKPITMIKAGTITGDVHINYAISNAGTAIYLDALEIEKENAYPKVSYTIDPNVLNKSIVSTLYNKLNWLVMINDVQLKFENVFGYISKLELDLDFPDKDSIEVKNYKTKFEDLFSNIVASTEALQSNSKMLSSLAAGTYGLSADGLASTLEVNNIIFKNAVEECIKESKSLDDTLTDLVTAIGGVISNTAEALSTVDENASKNSIILGDFAQTIKNELNPRIYAQPTAPENYKKGDVWLEINSTTGEIVNRYLAMSDSKDSVGAEGWCKTYDGGLAQIKGACMNLDVANGKIDILAENELNLASGHLLKLSGEDVQITGSNSVNIGGPTINIGSTVITNGNSTATVSGGINITAAQLDRNHIFNRYDLTASKVLIHPDEISMYGSKITMGVGVLDDNEVLTESSVLSLDPDTGIYLGSSKGIHFFSEKLNASPRSASTVDIDSTQISLGVIGANSGTVVALKQDVIILGAANSVTDLQTNKVTWTSTITGVTIAPSAIGLAAMNGNTRSAVIMNGEGVMIGSVDTTNQGDINAQGAYVKILSSGVIDIGGTGNLNINNSNMYLNANASSGTVFELKHTNNNTTTSYIKYTADGKLYLTADQITLGSQTVTSQTGFEMSPAKIWAGVKSATSGNTTALTITDSSLNLDVDTNNYVHISTAGIEMLGKHILINGKQEWSRDDIIFSQTKPNPPKDGRAWVWIKPMSTSSLTYSSVNGGTNKTGYKAVDIYTSAYNYFATSSTTVYTYKITIVMHMNYSDNSDAVFVWLATSADGAGVQFIGKAEVPFGYYAQGRSQTSTVTFIKDLTGQNFCGGSSTYALIKVTDPNYLNQNYNYSDTTSNENVIKPSSHYVIESVTLEAVCPQDTTGASGVPCDVYYYSATSS